MAALTRALVLIAPIALVLTLRPAPAVAGQAAGSSGGPLVVLLDSAHPARIYDEATIAAKRTNADVLSDVLADLPIRRHAETISPEWRRDAEIAAMKPALVVVHYSGFNLAEATGPRERLKVLLSVLAPTPARVLVYSRAREADLVANLSTLLTDVYATNAGFRDRLRAFGLNDYGPPQWIGSPAAGELKRVVRTMLSLP